ncbi:MAG: alpha/beta hydrolase [Ruminococcus sp.]|nr:alpha/beta hydrolase [Ruminococcus sp.]
MKKLEKNAILHPANQNGIYLYEFPLINGVKQYIQVRGEGRNNPLILFIHGGPGGAVAGLTHILQAGWEEKFTVVNWDQRNSGKTYFANKQNAKEIACTGTMDDYIKDVDEIIDYLHTVYDFEKIIIMGFSWGSAIGSEYAKRHPENVLCYVGVGQFINFKEGFHFICRKIKELAKNDETDLMKINEFEASIPDVPVMTKEFSKKLRIFIALGTKYISKGGRPYPLKELFSSPFLTFREKIYYMHPGRKMLEKTFNTMFTYDFRQNMKYDIPVIFIYGVEDFSCPVGMLEECLCDISAPLKKLEIMPAATHSCFFDKPEEFMEILMNNIPR